MTVANSTTTRRTSPGASERTPLLNNVNDDIESTQGSKVPDVYDRFSPGRKRVILAIVSWSGLIPLFISGSFIPCIPQIARDFGTTGSVVNLAVSLSILTVSLTSLIWAKYSGFYGRRPIYLSSQPILILGSIGVGCSQTITQLMVFRFIQSFGAASGMSVGSGTIADIYRLEERGTAMGIFFAAILLGPALAPLAGGIAAYFFTWRHMQFALAAAGLMALLLMIFFMPETSQPGARGLDKLMLEDEEAGESPKWRWVWLNPLSSLWLLRSPNLMAVCLAGTFVLLADYVLLVPLAYTIGVRYGIENEALIGAFFLPAGLGNTIGAPLAGRLSDQVVHKWRQRRGGKWIPEDRLRATLLGAAVFAPASVLLSGIFTRYLPGRLGIVLNLICLFFNGLGVDFVLSPSSAYNVDVLHAQSAEVMAATTGFRGIILAFATTAILPSINSLGVVATDCLSAGLAWIGFVLLYATIRYGDRMRAWVDVGFSSVVEAGA